MNKYLLAISLLVTGFAVADSTVPKYEDCSIYKSSRGISDEAFACIYRVQDAKKAYEAAQREELIRTMAENMKKNSPSHSGYSYQRCIIKKMPSAQNDYAARVLDKECQQFPYYAKEVTSDFFGYSTADECFGDTGGKPASKIASILLKRACDGLFP